MHVEFYVHFSAWTDDEVELLFKSLEFIIHVEFTAGIEAGAIILQEKC